ncbi:hypothetical protein ABZ023_32945 [Streptomyces sp. NPDC006367]|uniref:hypothetical protein n=1 Tax=unclassified Streptomyces TaxID=2593676 RepID=UPI0033A2D914
MVGRSERPARSQAFVSVVVVAGVLAFAVALVANAAQQVAVTWTAVAAVMACTVWLAWDGWRRWQCAQEERRSESAK